MLVVPSLLKDSFSFLLYSWILLISEFFLCKLFVLVAPSLTKVSLLCSLILLICCLEITAFRRLESLLCKEFVLVDISWIFCMRSELFLTIAAFSCCISCSFCCNVLVEVLSSITSFSLFFKIDLAALKTLDSSCLASDSILSRVLVLVFLFLLWNSTLLFRLLLFIWMFLLILYSLPCRWSMLGRRSLLEREWRLLLSNKTDSYAL